MAGRARRRCGILDEMLERLRAGDVRGDRRGDRSAISTGRSRPSFRGPATLHRDADPAACARSSATDFWGFWMLGGMSGGGMGFIFAPARKAEAQERLQEIMSETKRELEHACRSPWSRWSTISRSTSAARMAELLAGDAALMPAGYYTLTVPALLRTETAPAFAGAARRAGPLRRRLPHRAGVRRHGAEPVRPPAAARAGAGSADARRAWTALLEQHGFDRVQHEQIQADCAAGASAWRRIACRPAAGIEDVQDGDVLDATAGLPARYRGTGHGRRWRDGDGGGGDAGRRRGQPLDQGRRRGEGAAIRSAKLGGRHRTFIEVHLAKSRRISRLCGSAAAARHHHQLSDARRRSAASWPRAENYGYPGPLLLSPGRSIGLRMIPMVRDLRFAWEEMPQQLLDEQAQKVRESLHAALIGWARQAGEASELHRQPAAAVPASGGPLVRGAEPAAQRRAGATARGAAAAAVPDGAQHRHAGRGRGPGAARASTSRAARR